MTTPTQIARRYVLQTLHGQFATRLDRGRPTLTADRALAYAWETREEANFVRVAFEHELTIATGCPVSMAVREITIQIPNP